jgi:hypothetical protein
MNRRSLLSRAAALTAVAFIAPEIVEAEARKYFALDQTMLSNHGYFNKGYGLTLHAGDILTLDPQSGRWAKAHAGAMDKDAILTYGFFDGRKAIKVGSWDGNGAFIKIEGV